MKYSVVYVFEVCSSWHRTGFSSLWQGGKNSNNTDELEKNSGTGGQLGKYMIEIKRVFPFTECL